MVQLLSNTCIKSDYYLPAESDPTFKRKMIWLQVIWFTWVDAFSLSNIECPTILARYSTPSPGVLIISAQLRSSHAVYLWPLGAVEEKRVSFNLPTQNQGVRRLSRFSWGGCVCDSLAQLKAVADTCSEVSLRKNLEEEAIDGGSSQSKC